MLRLPVVVGFALWTAACSRSHEIVPTDAITAAELDAALVDADVIDAFVVDTGPDTSADAGADLGPPPSELVGDFSALVGATDTHTPDLVDRTWLVVGGVNPDVEASLVRPHFVDENAVFDRVATLSGTAACEPASASRDGDKILIAFRCVGRQPLLLIYDAILETTIASRALEFLPIGTPESADVVYDDPNVTLIVGTSPSTHFEARRLRRVGDGLQDVAMWGLDEQVAIAAIRDADGRGAVIAGASTRDEVRTWHISDSDFFELDVISSNGSMPSWAASTLAYAEDSAWRIGERTVDIEDDVTVFRGEPSLARFGDVAFLLASGINAGRVRAWHNFPDGSSIRTVDSPIDNTEMGSFDRYPVAHIEAERAGVFYLNQSLSTRLPRVRYVGVPIPVS